MEPQGASTVSARAGLQARALKRALDVAVAGVLLLVALPLLALVALAVLLDSPGPVFYRAERVGRNGRPLRMLKFRKMVRDARGPRVTLAGDGRLTRVGALLTRTRLDELPQFWHVLRGEMSLVGPRPEDPSFIAMRPADFAEILQAKPGITGLSQLAYADERKLLRPDDPVGDYVARILPQKCALDRLYVAGASVRRDLGVLWWTIVAVLLRRQVAVHRTTGALGLRRRPT
jgi:lipopolysaccharide/colanic/teichoic acid biosynthesis glycosyltransferase